VATALQAFRERHPEFSELSDFEVADGLRRKFNNENDAQADVRSFFEGIGGPALGPTIELGTREEREAAGTLSPAEGGDFLPPPDGITPPMQGRAAQELQAPVLPEPGTPAAQLTGPNLQPQIEGGRELEESIGRFARGEAPPQATPAPAPETKPARLTSEILEEQTATQQQAGVKNKEAFAQADVPGLIVGEVMNQPVAAVALALMLLTKDQGDEGILATSKRRVSDIASGTVAFGGGALGYLGAKLNSETLQTGEAELNALAQDLMPASPSLVDELLQGFGSQVAMWAPGIGIARGAAAIAKFGQVAALWAGAGASGVLEAMAEAGNTFRGLVDSGVKPDEAERRADAVFFQNTAIVTLFNRFGLFGANGQAQGKALLTGLSESAQEWFQAMIGNVAEDRPILEGAAKSAAFGFIIGNAAQLATGGALPQQQAPGPEPGPFPQGGPGFTPPPAPTPEEQEAIDADVPTPAPPGPLGEGTRDRTAFTPGGQAIETVFTVVDAEDLVTSNDATGKINPAFPAELQPRDRTRKASGVQIAKIAGNLNPALLGESQTVTDGAPIIGDDLVVESGNARVLAIRQALEGDTEQGRAYRQFLFDNAERFGLAPAEFEGVENPVLVRVRRTEVDRAAFTREANQATIAALSPAEQARADAASLTADDLSLFNPDQSGNVLAASNDQFLRIFLSRIGGEAAAGFTNAEGRPTKQLADRMNAAIFARVYGDERLTELQAEEADPQIRNILAALQAAAPAFAKAKAIDEELGGLNVPEKIVDAVQLIRDVQARGGTIEQLLEQGDLFGDVDPEVQGFARFIAANNRSAERMGRAFSTIAEFLQTEVARQQTDDIFGDKGASLPELLAAANREIEKRNAEETKATGGTQGDIFGANPPRVTPPTGAQPPPGAGDLGGQPAGQPGAAPGGAAPAAPEPPAAGPAPGPGPAAPAPTQARGETTGEGEQIIALDAEELGALNAAFDDDDVGTAAEIIDSVSIEVDANDAPVSGELIAPTDEEDRAELRQALNDIADRIATTDETGAIAMRALALDIVPGAQEEAAEAQPELTDAEINDAVERLAGLTEGRTEEVVQAIAKGANLTQLAAIIGKGAGGFSMARKATEGSVTVTSTGNELFINFGPDQTLRLTPGEIGRRLKVILAGETIFEGPEKRRPKKGEGGLQQVAGDDEFDRIVLASVGTDVKLVEKLKKAIAAGATNGGLAKLLPRSGQLVVPRRGEKPGNLVVVFAPNQLTVGFRRGEEQVFKGKTLGKSLRRVFEGGAAPAVPAVDRPLTSEAEIEALLDEHAPAGSAENAKLVALSLTKPRPGELKFGKAVRALLESKGVTTLDIPDSMLGNAALNHLQAQEEAAAEAAQEQGERSLNAIVAEFNAVQKRVRAVFAGKGGTQAEREEMGAEVFLELRALQVELAEAVFRDRAPADTVKPPGPDDRRTAKAVASLRKTADGMQKAIDAKMDPATAGQNATPRRARIIDSMQADGRRLQKIQSRLRAMADATEAGALPIILANVRSKAMVEDLMRATFPEGKFSEKENKRAGNAGLRDQATWEQARAAIQSLEVAGPTTEPTVEARRRFEKLRRELVGLKGVGVDFFPTPAELAEELVDQADAQAEQGPSKKEGDSVLEPSAGSGNIIEAMAAIYSDFPQITVTALEQSSRLVEVLEAQAAALADTHDINVKQGDFLEYNEKHDIIVMNPPFGKGADIDHLRHAHDLLNNNGRVVAVMSEAGFIGNTKKQKDFRAWLESVNATVTQLDAGALADKRFTQRSNVRGRIVEIDKVPTDAELADTDVSERGTSYMIREPEPGPQEAGQLDLFAPEGKPKPPATVPKKVKQAAKPRVKQVRTGTFRSGLDQVHSAEDAAHVVAPLRKEAQESFIALVLGKNNTVLRIIRHSVGNVSGATADAGIISGAVAETPGAESVYFAHNHPSGVPKQSQQDRATTEQMAMNLAGSGIQVKGALVVAPGSPTATILSMNPQGEVLAENSIVIKAAPRRFAVPVTERRIRKVPRELKGATLSAPAEAKIFMRQQKGEGVLLIDNRHRPLQWLRMSVPEMRALRTGKVGTGANKLQQAIVQQNAAAAMVKVSVASEGALDGLRNVGQFMTLHRVRMLDGFLVESDGSLTSLTERNMPIERTGGTFNMETVPPGAGSEVDIEERSLEAVRQIIIRAGGTVLIQTDVDGDLSLDIVELPKSARDKGSGSEFMAALTTHADTFGRDIELTPSPLDIDRKRENRAEDVARLVTFYERFGFTQTLDKARMFRTTATTPRPTVGEPGGTQPVTTEKLEPGSRFVPLLRDQDLPVDTTGAPKKPGKGFGVFKTPIAPDRPLRRERILRNIERDFGVRIYQGRIKGNRAALGFYRAHIEELRLKDNNAIEVAAHEIAHFMDDIDPRFKEAYKAPEFVNEIREVSYDIKQLNEGFAEFVRLFLTQEEEAVSQAPAFYDKFIELIEGSKFEKGLIRAQSDMHAWFRQGAENRALSKIGRDKSLNGRVQDVWAAMRDFADQPADAAIASMFDAMQGLKVLERTVTGTIGDADVSPYKIVRLVAGIRGVVRAVFRKGTIGYAANGDVVFTGDGLEQVFKPIADVMDDAMAYFAGKRAGELFRQRRENLFSRSEIQALIDKGKDNPRIVQAFKDFQAFNKRMMQFYEDSGLLSRESRIIIEELNKSYVSFQRIIDLATGQVKPGARAQFIRLRGGTANVGDIYGNIMQSVAALVDAAVKNKAKQRVYAMVQRGQGAAQFAARIPRETQAVQLDSKQVAAKVKGILSDMGVDLAEILPEGGMGFGEDFETAAGQFMTFFTFGNAPIGDNIDSVMIRGKRVYFEIADPLFLKAMLALGPQTTNLALRIGLGFKHTLTFGVTAMPSFFIPNLTRDSVSGFLLRRSNMLPVVSSIRGILDRMQKSDAYWEYLANGGGFASSVQVETGSARRNLERLYAKSGIDFKNVLHGPRRLVDWWVEVGSAFEYGTRLAEFKASRKQGKSAAESTFRGRDVSTDFAMRGTSDFIRMFTATVPFLNARAQGLYKLQREVFEKDGKQRFKPGDRAYILARRSLLLMLPSLILWGLNRDDERYKALPEWIKDLHWVIFVPGKEEPVLIMKPFEMGMLFASIPERIAEAIVTQDGDQLGDSLWFMITEQANMNLIPQVINPGYEHARNRNWMGGKIIPDDLANVDPAEQFRPWSSDTSILLGQKVGLSPLLFDHYVKGYLGTMGTYALMASDGLVSGLLPESPTKQWADRPIIRRFTRALPLRRTSYEDQFYELRNEVRRITSTFNKILDEQRDPTDYIKQGNREQLFSLSQTINSVSREISALNGAIRQTRLSGVLSPDEKLAEIKKLRRTRNRLFKDVSEQFSPAQLEQLRTRLEQE